MTPRFLLLLFSSLSLFINCHAQTKGDSIEIMVLEKLQEWAKNPSFSKDTFDLKILDSLKDSGLFVNNLKEGIWIEYSIDSSRLGVNSKVIVGDKSIDFSHGITLEKSVGTYQDGRREGMWTMFRSFDNELPLSWGRKSETDYRMGLKNGVEIVYQGYGELQKPLITSHYLNGIENGEGKIYNSNSPYNLSKIYIATNGNLSVTDEFYDNGKLHFLVIDTNINNQSLKFMRTYDEQTNLTETSFFLNDSILHGVSTTFYLNGKVESETSYKLGELDGTYKYYYDNGQLWIERTYEKGKAKDVISNFDKTGKARDKGNLMNGNGTVISYDEEGNQKNVRKYVDGQKLKDK